MTADGTLAANSPAAHSLDADVAVAAAARAARGAVADLASVPAERLDDALRAMARQLSRRAGQVLAANEADMRAARQGGHKGAPLDPAPPGPAPGRPHGRPAPR